MMIKLLICAVSLLGLAYCFDYDEELLGCRRMGPYNPIPNDDVNLNKALNETKGLIIEKVIVKYPNITDAAKIKINSAEIKSSLDKAFPSFIKYRANITLMRKTQFVKRIHDPEPIYEPVITFNVTILVKIPGDGTVSYIKVRIIGLPGIDERLPWSDISVNDTGLWIGLEATGKDIWAEVQKASGIKQFDGSTIREDFVVMVAGFKGPIISDQSQTTKYLYKANISLSLKYPSIIEFQYAFSVKLLAKFVQGQLIFKIIDFKSLGYTGIINIYAFDKGFQLPALPELKSTEVLLVPKDSEVVDFVDFYRLLDKFGKTIARTITFLNHLNGSDVVVPDNSHVSARDVQQTTVVLPPLIYPPYYRRTYTATNVKIHSSNSPFGVLVSDITLVLSEVLRNETQNGPLLIADEKVVRLNNYVLPDVDKSSPLTLEALPVKVEKPSPTPLFDDLL